MSGLGRTLFCAKTLQFKHLTNYKITCLQCFKEINKPSLNSIKAYHQLQQASNRTVNWSLRSSLLSPLRRCLTNVAVESSRTQKIVGYWLMGCAGMCFGAVVLGGVTRLTESGLSMVDWRLIKDMKPPKSEAEWLEEFEKYKQYPEYKYMEKEMTLSDFKFIYYMEWGHRMWGRTTGVAFFLPALYFLKKGWISKSLKPRLAVYGGLLAFQGFLGWYMVKSGLEEKSGPNDVPRVSHYRLAAHLGSAFILYTLFLWQGLSHLLTPVKLPDVRSVAKLRGMAHGVMTAVFVTAMSGAFVAGLDAGLTYNSYPKMADKWFPDDMWSLSPKWKNVFENPTFVQFNHRHLAELTVCFITGFWWVSRKAPLHPRARLAVTCLLGMAFGQAALGITTLLTYVPTSIAATHQSGSLVLLSLAVWVAHELRRMPK
ncbi:cytochrome c oxidase assembly protein COX15 homolog isoform X1 [Biomphalaria glabrata]|uniref:Cytochrome c oxidase assembly protein COX15 homolog isoform X1 n=1 Tax=Biomphalaria glabrata TaxID=6526 RepID=A0A9W2ZVC5_BIOGL|nr:cytochrome c oxidase assembly protein COX15 homolog isoform X1 [Biomphalaria glabrata]